MMDIVEELRRDRESGAKRLETEYKAGLMTLARRFCNDEGDAEELVNRTFAEVINGIDDYLEQSAFFAWMCQILVNLRKRDNKRKSNKTVVYPGVVPEMVDDDAQEAIYRNLDYSLLRDAIAEMPTEMRELLLLHYFMEIPIPKLAKILAVPAGTVKSRLHYARSVLAAKMGVAVKKPGGKAVLLALLLCGLTALGAAVGLPVARLLPFLSVAVEQQADSSKDAGQATGTARQADACAATPSATSQQTEASNLSTFQPFNFSTENPQGDTMNKTTLRTIAASAAIAAATGAPRSASAAMDTWQDNATTPVVQITVGSDMTLTEALAANGVSLDGAASLVKLGNGTVTVDDASGIGSFAGEIHVFQGGWSVGTAAGFGTSAGATWVYPNGCVLDTDATVSHSGEVFHLAGTGKSDWFGWGAIRFPENSQSSVAMAAGAYGSRWILEDDATILLTGNGNSRAFLPSVDLDLNGHALTLWRGKYGAIEAGYSANSQFGMFHSVSGSGDIVLKNGVTLNHIGFDPSSYTPDDRLVLQNAIVGFSNTKTKEGWELVARALPATDWRTDAAPASSLLPRFVLRNWGSTDHHTSHYANMWSGPVALECDLVIGSAGQTYAEPMTFTNKVTGAGGLSVVSGKTWLYLDCPDNDFDGGVALAGPDSRLVLGADGALPSDGGRLVLTNSTVAFPADAAQSATTWSLPALELAGTSVVQNCQGAWRSVRALSGSDATYASALGASALTLEPGARLTLGSLFDRADWAGWNVYYDLDHSTDILEDIPFKGTNLSPTYAEGNTFRWTSDSNGQVKTATRCFAYKTYLWNNSPTNETWTFAGHFGSPIRLWLNGNKILDYNSYYPYRATGTLRPGANSFVLLSFNSAVQGTTGSSHPTWANVDNKGFAYAVGDVPLDDPNDFRLLTDPGDGSICTRMSGDAANDVVRWSPSFTVLAMESGSVLDVNGQDISVETTKGSGIVTNGSLSVSVAVEVDPVVLGNAGGLVVDGSLAFGEGAKISFPDSDASRNDAPLKCVLAKASGGIAGFTGSSMLEIGGTHKCWKAGLSADGKELFLEYVPECTIIMMR